MQLNSDFYFAIASLLKLIESLNIPADQYGVLDGGETLEISMAVRDHLQPLPEFARFQEMGGSYYCYDDNEYVVA